MQHALTSSAVNFDPSFPARHVFNPSSNYDFNSNNVFILQDLFESPTEKAENLKKHLEMCLGILNGELTSVPDNVDFPHGEEILKATLSFVQQAKASIPFWDKLKEWFVEAYILSYDSTVLGYMLDVYGDSGLSSLTFRAYAGDDAHVETTVSLVMALHGFSVCRRVRNTFLFRRLIESLKNICVGLNAVVGIGKDIRKEDVNTFVLAPVHYHGVKLQTSWDNAIKWMKKEKLDFIRICNALRKSYPKDENLHKAVRVCENLEQAHTLWMCKFKAVRYA